MDKPFVSIVIPAYNAQNTISLAIKGCLRQDYPLSLLEIIVVDDGSTDNTRKIVSQFESVRYMYQTNHGPASARNNGMHHAKGSLVAFLDSDCVPRKSWISKMISRYTSDDIVCVGSRYGLRNRGNFIACCIYFEFLIRYKRMPRHPKFLGSHGYSFRKSFLVEIGGYSEEYTMASHEDNELAYRIISKGYITYFDKSNIVDHHFPTNFFKYLRVQLWHGYWRMKLYVDHPHMVTGDDYTDIWDYMQPPFTLALLVLIPFYFISPIFLFLELTILTMIIFMQMPIALRMVRLCKKKRYFLYIPLGIIRAAARSIGMIIGILHFWILRRERNVI
jgi:glycosyltransferase involved in cell wall biosynthesis